MAASLYSSAEFKQAIEKIDGILEGNEASRELRAEIKGLPAEDKGICHRYDHLVRMCIVNDEFFLSLKNGSAAEQHAALAEAGLTVTDLIYIWGEFPIIKTDLDLTKVELPKLPELPELSVLPGTQGIWFAIFPPKEPLENK